MIVMPISICQILNRKIWSVVCAFYSPSPSTVIFMQSVVVFQWFEFSVQLQSRVLCFDSIERDWNRSPQNWSSKKQFVHLPGESFLIAFIPRCGLALNDFNETMRRGRERPEIFGYNKQLFVYAPSSTEYERHLHWTLKKMCKIEWTPEIGGEK